MLGKEFPQIVPPPPAASEVLEAAQVTRQFYQEVQYRADFEHYCQWYYATAERNRQELQKMRRDVNILGWFLRRGR